MWQELWSKELFDFGGGQAVVVSQLAMSLVVLLLGMMLSALLSRLRARRLERSRVTPGAAQAIRKVGFYILLVAVILAALRILHIPITMFAFLCGAVAIGVGFGAQNIINNFISGWILIAEWPVRIGDLVEVEQQIGRVETIGGRCTRIKRTDGIGMLVPNSVMLERTVVNWTLIDQDIRTTVRVGVQYGSPSDQVAKLIRQAVDEHESILKQPEPVVIFDDFGDNSLIFDVYFWCNVNAEMQLRIVRSEIRFLIDKMFRKAEIVIAYLQRDVHLDAPWPISVRVMPNDTPPTT